MKTIKALCALVLTLLLLFTLCACGNAKDADMSIKYNTVTGTGDVAEKTLAGKYTGEVSEKLPNGKGSFTADTASYEGEFSTGYLSGDGTCKDFPLTIIVNNNDKYSYYINQVDESYHLINRIEINSLTKDDVLSGIDDMQGRDQ